MMMHLLFVSRKVIYYSEFQVNRVYAFPVLRVSFLHMYHHSHKSYAKAHMSEIQNSRLLGAPIRRGLRRIERGNIGGPEIGSCQYPHHYQAI